MIKKFTISFNGLTCMSNLLSAWREFLLGKRARRDVQEYSLNLMDNILSLQSELVNKTYRHGDYLAFNICDPKPRNIHKANVQDRLLHHAIHRQLYPFFSKKFIADSYSCQLDKGVHKALKRFQSFSYKVSKNNTRTGWVLKGDIKKFFANIDHEILKNILKTHITDKNIIWLLENIIDSFHAKKTGVGLPLGNLTSQLFINIYMNEFDQFVKHRLKAKYYIRYCDDFVIFSENKEHLENLIPVIKKFLDERLKLELHPNKLFIQTISSGVDFLGWKHYFNHRLLRTVTKRRMLKRIKTNPKLATFESYKGLMKHGNTKKIQKQVWEQYILHHDNI